ncbi:MAG: TAXI family TRAP transporter solute-binding subunit [Myxococcota bacterium]|nr:TAXI family TRAP transporter solute-binding subunit [Myxococcota bacterium]
MSKKKNQELLKLSALGVFVIGLGFLIASHFVSPEPPHTISLASGHPGGAYSLFAQQYRDELAKNEIEVEVIYTHGSVENLELLSTGAVDLAIIQSGVATLAHPSELLSLGSVFLEPLWVFLPQDSPVTLLSDLSGQRLEVGPQGSGTRALAEQMLALNDIRENDAIWLSSTSADAAVAITQGRADAVFLVGSVDSPVIRTLITRNDIRLLDIKRAEAYTRLDRSFSKVLLPEGVVDLRNNLPPDDKNLVSTAAELVVGPEFHPALVDLLLQAATHVHGEGDLFTEPGTFPSPRWVDLPLDPDAERYFEYGPPFLQRYMPFWAATQVDRLKVMLIPLLALLLPLMRLFPPTYRWRVRSRIYRWYRQLRLADATGNASLSDEEIRAKITELNQIETEVAKVETPTSYAEELYSLRLHIDFVRRKLEESAHQHDTRPKDD